MNTKIPFTGFYESDHNEQINRGLEELTQDSSGNQIKPEALDIPGLEELWQEVNYQEVFLRYSQEYVKNFLALLGAECGTKIPYSFGELSSPREYNFTTDVLIVDIPAATIKELYEKVDKRELDRLIRRDYTSCSGFISFYPNSLEAWGPVEAWDSPQIGSLIEALWLQFVPDPEEAAKAWNIMEGDDVSDWVYDALTEKGRALMGACSDYRHKEEEQWR